MLDNACLLSLSNTLGLFILQRIIRDLPVTPTTGNGETQDFASGAATQVESTIIDGTLQIIVAAEVIYVLLLLFVCICEFSNLSFPPSLRVHICYHSCCGPSIACRIALTLTVNP